MPTLALDVVKLSVADFSFSYILPLFNPTALRKTKIVYNFGLSECNTQILNFSNAYFSSGCGKIKCC